MSRAPRLALSVVPALALLLPVTPAVASTSLPSAGAFGFGHFQVVEHEPVSVTFVLRDQLRTGRTPSGTLTFFDVDPSGALGSQLGTGTLAPVPNQPGVASATLPEVALAELHDVAATYSGDMEFAAIGPDDPIYGNAEVVDEAPGAVQDLQRLYFDVLGRAPDAGGFAYWLPVLEAGGYEHAAWAFANSDEHLLDMVDDAYQQVLERPADESGARYYLGHLRKGMTLMTLRLELAVSPEAREVSVFGFDETSDFVDWIYWSILGRHSDYEGATYYRWGINEGRMTRGGVAWDLAHSAEAIRNDLDDLYQGFLDREVDEEEGLPYWTAAVRSGYRLEHVAFSITQSAEYRHLHAVLQS